MQVLSAAILHPHLQCFSLMPENNFTWPTFFSPYVSANYMDDVWILDRKVHYKQKLFDLCKTYLINSVEFCMVGRKRPTPRYYWPKEMGFFLQQSTHFKEKREASHTCDG